MKPTPEAVYDITANSPLLWRRSAVQSIAAANVCMRRVEAFTAAWGYHQDLTAAPAMMLYGFGVEALLKALLLSQGRTLAAGGTLDKKFKTHNLVALCGAAGLALNEDERFVLAFLSAAITGFGRYPVGSKARAHPVGPQRVVLQRDIHALTLDFLTRVDDAAREQSPTRWERRFDVGSLGLRLRRQMPRPSKRKPRKERNAT